MQEHARTSSGRRTLVQSMAWTLAVAPALLGGASPAQAQADFPNKALRIVVPFAPGGPSDVLARLLSTSLQEGFRQPVIVDNRAGAGGLLGFEMVIKAQIGRAHV